MTKIMFQPKGHASVGQVSKYVRRMLDVHSSDEITLNDTAITFDMSFQEDRVVRETRVSEHEDQEASATHDQADSPNLNADDTLFDIDEEISDTLSQLPSP